MAGRDGKESAQDRLAEEVEVANDEQGRRVGGWALEMGVPESKKLLEVKRRAKEGSGLYLSCE